jgi:glucose/arabinose dehydrogenase
MLQPNSNHRRTRTLVSGAFAVLLVASVPALAQEALDDPIPRTIKTVGSPLTLTNVAEGMTAPNWAESPPGQPSQLWVVDQDGTLWSLDLRTGDTRVVLDVSDRLIDIGVAGPGTFDERGFLGLAFHPDYATNGLLYTYTSEPAAAEPDFSTMPPGVAPNHQSVVAEWHVPAPTAIDAVVDPDTRREILRIDQPQFNHDAGALAFGADDLLFIALGDGGAADDQGVGHVPGGNGQDPGNVLGTILRIDPRGTDGVSGVYGIPADNPFVGSDEGLDEVYAYGFRNPFRISFDRATGELYVADVGQNDIEEVDIVVAGGNYGWPLKEGSFPFDMNGDGPGFVTDEDLGAPGLIDPIAEYDHDEGIAVVGGFVYRGERIPQLRGRYVFGDFLQPAAGSGRLFNLRPDGRIGELRLPNEDGGVLGLRVLGFGQDAAGELYVLANETGTPFGDTGVVRRIDPFRG